MFKRIVGVLRSAAQTYDVDDVSRETGLEMDLVNDPSRTIQSGKDDADINVIVRRFGVTGLMPVSPRVPSYGDYEGVGDFQTAMNVVRAAEEHFLSLPAELRKRFGNSPQAYLEFCSNAENIDEMVKLGLAIRVESDILPPKSTDGPSVRRSKGDARRSGSGVGKAGKATADSDGDGDGVEEGT